MNEVEMKAIGKQFVPGDYHLTFAFYKNQKDIYETANRIAEFQEKISALCIRHDKSLRLFTTVHESERTMHVHILAPRLPIDEIKGAWKYGRVQCCELDEEGKKTDYIELIKYMLRTNKKGAEAPHKIIFEKGEIQSGYVRC